MRYERCVSARNIFFGERLSNNVCLSLSLFFFPFFFFFFFLLLLFAFLSYYLPHLTLPRPPCPCNPLVGYILALLFQCLYCSANVVRRFCCDDSVSAPRQFQCISCAL